MTTSAPLELTLCGAEATVTLGRRVGSAVLRAGGGVVTLSGHLGAGKTTFVKGLAEGLGVAAARDVTSPTFLRVVRFEGSVPLVHVDAFRMKSGADLVELGLDEDMAGAACVAIEWPEHVADALPPDRLAIELSHRDETSRGARLVAALPRSSDLLDRIRSSDVSAGGRKL
jgi:tRNA threonylcarbamoyladenosine biosynthesis protein TsaE